MIVFEAWRSFPFAFLFLTARLQAVPGTLEEAADVDGATPTQRFAYVLLPQLLPTIAVLSVLRFIWTFNSFDDIYLLTGGGAGTEVVSVRVFNALTARGDIGAASGPGSRARLHPGLPRHLVPAPLPDPGRGGLMTTAMQQDRRSTDTRPAPTLARGGRATRSSVASRCAALGGHRPAASGDALSLLLHGDALDPAPRSGRPGPRGVVRAAQRVGAGQLSCCARITRGGRTGLPVFIRNSAVIALSTVALTLLVALPGAYAVSRLEFFGRRQVSGLFLAVYLFPSILLAAAVRLLHRIGLRGTLVGLIIVYVSQIVAVSIYMLRNYFDTIPVSLEEAAAIDGCTRLGIMRRISLPLAMPAIMSNALFVFMIAWNEFLFACCSWSRSATGGRSRWVCPSWPAASRSPPPS